MQSSLNVMQEMLAACVGALKGRLDEQGWKPLADGDESWAQLFGKESVSGALAKLVNMHKSLMEQQQEMQASKPKEPEDLAPLSEADWQLLAMCVERHYARREVAGGKASGDGAAEFATIDVVG